MISISLWSNPEINVVSVIVFVDKGDLVVSIKDKFHIETFAAELISEGIKVYDEIVCSLTGIVLYLYALKKLDLDLKNRPTHLAKPSIGEPHVFELKE